MLVLEKKLNSVRFKISLQKVLKIKKLPLGGADKQANCAHEEEEEKEEVSDIWGPQTDR